MLRTHASSCFAIVAVLLVTPNLVLGQYSPSAAPLPVAVGYNLSSPEIHNGVGYPQSSQFAGETYCDCGASSCSGGLGRLGAKRSQGLTVKDMWSRHWPEGNQGLNFPYHTRQLYYYKRPYNTLHVRRTRDAQFAGGVGFSAEPNQLYSTEVFDMVHRQLSDEHQRSTELGYLEYNDWRHYESARREWELHRPADHRSYNEPSNGRQQQTRAALSSLSRNSIPQRPNSMGRSDGR